MDGVRGEGAGAPVRLPLPYPQLSPAGKILMERHDKVPKGLCNRHS